MSHLNRGNISVKAAFSAKMAIMSVVFAAMFLLTAVSVYGVYAEWKNQRMESLKKSLTAARDCAAQQKTRVLATEILLRSLVMAYSNFGDGKFLAYLREMDWNSREYIKIAFYHPSGGRMLFAGEEPPSTPEEQALYRERADLMRGRAYFRNVLSAKGFTVGEYSGDSQMFAEAALPMAMPVYGSGRHLAAVAVAVLDMSFDDSIFRGIYDEHGIETIFFDRRHKLLYRYPLRGDAPLGKTASPHLRAAMGAGDGARLFYATDPFGRERSYAVIGLRQADDQEPYMYIVASGRPRGFAEFISSLYLPHMTGVTIAFILSMMLATVAGRMFFSSGLERLAHQVDAVKSGNLSERLDTVSGCREIKVLAEGMNSMLDSLEQTNTQLQKLSNTDALTGLHNRRRFYELAEQELKRGRRGKTPLAVAMLDLDHFKSINDTYGHDGGDAVLCSFSALLKDHLRSSDVAARFGGEEFVLLLPETDAAGAMTVMEKLRLLAAEKTVSFNGAAISCTLSAGVCVIPANNLMTARNKELEEELEAALKKADSALYKAKNNGRNQVAMA